MVEKEVLCVRKQIDERRYPLNTVKPLYRVPKMLHKIHRRQGKKIGDPVVLPGPLIWIINNDVTATEVCDRCHQPHAAFLKAFPIDGEPIDERAERILSRGMRQIFGLTSDDFRRWLVMWDQVTGLLVKLAVS